MRIRSLVRKSCSAWACWFALVGSHLSESLLLNIEGLAGALPGLVFHASHGLFEVEDGEISEGADERWIRPQHSFSFHPSLQHRRSKRIAHCRNLYFIKEKEKKRKNRRHFENAANMPGDARTPGATKIKATKERTSVWPCASGSFLIIFLPF